MKGSFIWKNVIIIVILVIILIFAVKGSVKHMMGEGECCGGGSRQKKVKKKKLQKVLATKSVQIERMTCDKCRMRVENALNSVEDINAKVCLHKKEAIVKIGKEIDDGTLEAIIKKQGYEVVSIKSLSE